MSVSTIFRRQVSPTSPGAGALRESMKQWRVPTELHVAHPRPVRFTAGMRTALTVVTLIAAVVVTLGVTMGLPAARRELLRGHLLRTEGIRTSANITRQWIREGDKGGPTYNVAYEYRVNDRILGSTAEIPRQQYSNLIHGVRAYARYARTRPEISQLEGEHVLTAWQVYLLCAFGVLVLLHFCIMPWLLTGPKRLLQWGRPMGAVLLSVKPARDKRRCEIVYEYVDDSGAVVRGKGSMMRSDLPEIGGAITILVDPERPKRRVPYPVWGVKLDTPG